MSALLERYERDATILADPMDEARRLADIQELMRRETQDWKPRQARTLDRGDLSAMGGGYYQDTRGPFATAVYPSVTLATTSKMLVRANPDTMVQPWEWWAGKKIMVRMFGSFTSAATPTSITLEMRLATADAGGTLLATSAALTWIASQTAKSWRYEGRITCFSTGNGGVSASLLSTGIFECSAAAVAAGYGFVPENTPAAVTVDLTGPVGISFQAKRAGSTAETMQVTDQEFVHLN